MSGTIDIQSRFIKTLKTPESNHGCENPQPCPQGYSVGIIDGRLFYVEKERTLDRSSLKYRQTGANLQQEFTNETSRSRSLDISALSLDPDGECTTFPASRRKRRANSELRVHRGKVPTFVETSHPDFNRNIANRSHSAKPVFKPYNDRFFNSKYVSDNRPVDCVSTEKQPCSPSGKQSFRTALRTVTTRRTGLIELQRDDSRYPGLVIQPDSRPITQEQLASEVKSVYAGLTMVETKCIHVDRAQAAMPIHGSNTKLTPDRWQALIALHRTLLHEHHDFFLASQHPTQSTALRQLAVKYAMPARMWKHGIHSFLEILRQRIPQSLDHMLAFIYLAYQMMALAYDTVPAFEDTWIELLGDLGRYRMAIEDDDIRDQETWANVSRFWYSEAAKDNPSKGRLYHHLAILASPNALQQLYYYQRSLNTTISLSERLEPVRSSTGQVSRPDAPLKSHQERAHRAQVHRSDSNDGRSADAKTKNFHNSKELKFSNADSNFRNLSLEGQYSQAGNVPNQAQCALFTYRRNLQLAIEVAASKLLRFFKRITICFNGSGCRTSATVSFMIHISKALALQTETDSKPTILLRKTSTFDLVCYCLIIPVTALLWFLGARMVNLSFTMMLLFAALWFVAANTTSMFDIRTTILQIWTPFALNYLARDCIRTIQPPLHAFRYLVISSLITIVAVALEPTRDDKLLTVFPPAVGVAALFLHFYLKAAPSQVRPLQTSRLPDEETGDRLPAGNERPIRPLPITPVGNDYPGFPAADVPIPHPDSFELNSLRSDGGSVSS